MKEKLKEYLPKITLCLSIFSCLGVVIFCVYCLIELDFLRATGEGSFYEYYNYAGDRIRTHITHISRQEDMAVTLLIARLYLWVRVLCVVALFIGSICEIFAYVKYTRSGNKTARLTLFINCALSLIVVGVLSVASELALDRFYYSVSALAKGIEIVAAPLFYGIVFYLSLNKRITTEYKIAETEKAREAFFAEMAKLASENTGKEDCAKFYYPAMTDGKVYNPYAQIGKDYE